MNAQQKNCPSVKKIQLIETYFSLTVSYTFSKVLLNKIISLNAGV